MKILPNNNQYFKIENNNLNKSSKEQELKKLKDACNEFEAMMINYMLKGVKSKDTLFDSGFEAEIYQDMYIENISKELSKNSTFDLGNKLYEQLSKRLIKEDKKENNEGLFKKINIKL